MYLKELLHEKAITVDLTPKDKWEIIKELVDVLIDSDEIGEECRDGIAEALCERERSMTTGIGNGVAIPHAACNVLKKMSAVFGICKAGLDFESLDGQPVYMVVLLVYPEAALQQRLKTLADVARLLNDAQIKRKLMDCENCSDVLKIIQQE